MQESPSQRRLAAILCADVAGYSRLMGEDEHATLAALTACRDVFFRIVKRFSGRIVNAPGDSILAEFGSVVDAVGASVEIQRELAERNAEEPGGRRMDFRIGVNLGDVLVKDGDLYGDGVNIAARIQALAEPGGISISGSVFDAVRGKLPLEFDFQGEQRVKNIENPVRTYRVLSKPGAAAHRVTHARRVVARHWRKLVMAGASAVVVAAFGAWGAWTYLPRRDIGPAPAPGTVPLPDQPSIAVLPFVNMSGDPDQDHFADGLTDTLITDLSSLRNLHVAARSNSVVYKGQQVAIQRVSAQLGVRYVLEGGIQKAGGNLRINAQLIDGVSGNHLWAERYDGPIRDLFAVQDEITQKIVTELNVKLVEGEYARIYDSPTGNVRARKLVLQGLYLVRTFSREGLARAEQLLKLALEIDPENLSGIVVLGYSHLHSANLESGDGIRARLNRAHEFSQRAISLDSNFSLAYGLRGLVAFYRDGNVDAGLADMRRAVALNPSDTTSLGTLAWILAYKPGSEKEALAMIQKAISANPVPPDWMNGALGAAQTAVGNYSAAISSLRLCIDRIPDYLACRLELLYAYLHAGQEPDAAEAREQAREILRIHPRYSIDTHPMFNLWRALAPEAFERFAGYLRKSGLS